MELDIFSGRRNPTWELSRDLSAEVQSLIRAASPLSQSNGEVALPGLGYRGFIIHGKNPIRVYRGQLMRVGKGTEKRFASVTMQLEKQLLESGKPHLEPSVYKSVAQTIESGGH